jgi:sulfopyruvate decarboxylase alpha subunit
MNVRDPASTIWQDQLFDVLKTNDVRQVAYVPDAGHARLIERAGSDPDIRSTVLTTEEEGVALVCGAWLGGERAVLLMQSSGVGNCVNMFSLLSNCRFPLLTLITMRGEWAEFNPWQVPMAKATQGVLEAMGISVFRATEAEDVAPVAQAAAESAFGSDQAAAVLLSQRLIGRKVWTSDK